LAISTAQLPPPGFDRIVKLDEAAFALDHRDRIVAWNRACEDLLGFKAGDVMGKMCHEVLRGADVQDNLYCYANCPVMYQFRRPRPRPVHDFPLWVTTATGQRKLMYFSSRVTPSQYPNLPTIIHVIRDHAAWISEDRKETEARARVLQRLTAREIEVLRCLAQGMTTRGIAARFSISSTTVRNHVQSLLQKLNVHTRSAAVGIAYEAGLIEGRV